MPAGGEEGAPSDFYRPEVLLGCAALMVLYLGVVLIAPSPFLDVPLGLAELLFVPGYALGAMLFPGRSYLSWPASLAIVVGLSVSANLFLGLGALAFHSGLPAPFQATAAAALAFLALLVRPHEASSVPRPLRQALAELTALPGFTVGQRRVAFGLLGATAVALALIVVLAGAHPNVHPAIALALEGPGGSVASLPTNGSVHGLLAVWVSVANGGSAQQLLLSVQSVNLSSSPSTYHVVPWTLPLPLANATQSSTAFNLPASQTYVLNLTFTFGYPGLYAVYLTLADTQGTTLRTAALTIAIH